MRIKVTISIAIIITIILFIAMNNKKNDYSDRANLLYNQKADNITFLEFGATGKLIQKTSAKNWIEYDNKPSIITLPNIHKYSNQSVVSADIATQITHEKIKLSGNVEIVSKENIQHNLKTNTLIALTNDDYFYSDDVIEYNTNEGSILAEGIKIFMAKNRVEFQKNSQILFNNGNKITSSNIKAVVIDTHKKFESLDATVFTSIENTIHSSGGFTLHDNQIHLLGKVKIQQKNSHIITNNLLINNNNYIAERSTYTENNIIINANAMHYNESKQLLTLSKNVQATYN